MNTNDSVVSITRPRQSRKVEDSSSHRHREISSMFRPILRLMKLTGEYYGDVSLDQALEADSSVFPCLYCAMLLVQIFENLEKKIRTDSPDVLTIEALRKEHHKLCETVALADKVFSPLIFVIVILDIPLLCINFHQLVKSPLSGEGNVIYIVRVLYWGIAVTCQLAFILWSGVRVNEKIHGFYDTLHNISVTDSREHLELLHFLMHLRGEPIGLSVGGLVVINKSLVLSLVGIIISYFAVLAVLRFTGIAGNLQGNQMTPITDSADNSEASISRMETLPLISAQTAIQSRCQKFKSYLSNLACFSFFFLLLWQLIGTVLYFMRAYYCCLKERHATFRCKNFTEIPYSQELELAWLTAQEFSVAILVSALSKVPGFLGGEPRALNMIKELRNRVNE
ncbi:hypothetical protein ACROYT_G022777 [Oculina patagonica]